MMDDRSFLVGTQRRQKGFRHAEVYLIEAQPNEMFSNHSFPGIVLDNALDAVISMDARSTVTYWNKQAEQIFGWSRVEVIGKGLASTIIPPEFREAHFEGLTKFLATEEGPILNSRVEVVALRKGGERFHAELTVIPIHRKGRYVFYFFIRDITQRKITEKELILRSEVLEHSLNGIDIVDADGRFIYANRSYLDMWGFSDVGEVLGTSPAAHCEDPSTPLKIISELKEKGECELEFVARRKDGSLFDVRMWARMAHDLSGNEIYPTTSVDITEQNRSREALKKSEELYQTTFSKAPIGILHSGANGRVENANDKLCEMLGYNRAELNGLTFSQITHPDDRPIDEIMYQKLRTGEVSQYDREKRYMRQDGSIIWVHVIGQLLPGNDGALGKFVTIVQDITDRKRSEEKKKILENRLQILSRLSRDLLEDPLNYEERLQRFVRAIVPQVADWCAVDIIDEAGNLKLTAVEHLDPEKVRLAHMIREKFPPEHRQAGPYHVIKTLQSELVPNIDLRNLIDMTENEEHFEFVQRLGMKSYICVPIIAHGENLGAFTMVSESVSYDRSDLSFAEDLAARAALSLYNSKLYQNAKEAVQARDEFLSVASHELKTPLTALKLQAQLMARLYKDKPEGEMRMEKISAFSDRSEFLVNRLDRLINDMLDISRIRTGKLTMNREVVDLVQVTKDLVEGLQEDYLAEEAEPISFSSPPRLVISVDVMRYEQVINNLLQNALKYGGGKRVTVRIAETNNSVLIKVSDAGMGISESNQKKIFQRFERVSDHKEITGLGLGLYISHQIIKSHGGRIWVDSKLGVGATFNVELPKNINEDRL